MWYNNIMKKTKEKLVNVAGAGIKEALEKQVYEQEKENLEAWIREIIREEIVNYNKVFMSKFGIDEDGVLHLTDKKLN